MCVVVPSSHSRLSSEKNRLHFVYLNLFLTSRLSHVSLTPSFLSCSSQQERVVDSPRDPARLSHTLMSTLSTPTNKLIMDAFHACEETRFTKLTLAKCDATTTAISNVLKMHDLLQRSSDASIKIHEATRSLVLTLSGPTQARKAAAIFTCYRATLPAAAKNFDFSLLDDKTLCRKICVPPQYDLSSVRSVLFSGKDFFLRSAAEGCLFDVSFLDDPRRTIMILSTKPEKRDALAAWIRVKVEGTAKVTAPPLSEQMAQRTIRSLIDVYGIEAQLASRAVGALEDKGDLEAAIDMVISLQSAVAPARVETDADSVSTHSDGSMLSSTRTSRMAASPLSFKAVVASPAAPDISDELSSATAFPTLAKAAKKEKVAPSPVAPKSGPAGSTPSAASSSSSSSTDECVVCMDGEAQFAFVPCGHRCACEACARAVKSSTGCCPMCSAAIETAIRIYV